MADRQEISLAFKYLDVEGKGKITAVDLKKRISAFYPEMRPEEYEFFMNNQAELTEKDIVELLQTPVPNFDAVQEAFGVYDPLKTGFMDLQAFQRVLADSDFSNVRDADVKKLMLSADVDGDGKVSLNDFRFMIDPKKASQQQGKAADQHDDQGSDRD